MKAAQLIHLRAFALIESCLVITGRVGVPELQRAFCNSRSSCSNIFTEYRKGYPWAVTYNDQEKAYIATDKFKPIILEQVFNTTAQEYFDAIQLISLNDILAPTRNEKSKITTRKTALKKLNAQLTQLGANND